MPEICEHCDMDRAYCIHGRPPEVSERPLRTGPIIEANYNTDCGWCPRRVHEGDLVSYTEECGWVHKECAEEPVGKVRRGGLRRGMP